VQLVLLPHDFFLGTQASTSGAIFIRKTGQSGLPSPGTIEQFLLSWQLKWNHLIKT